MFTTQPASDRGKGNPRIGLALAGGGALGIVYEIGALLALDEAMDGIDFNDLYAYVGVSAGAANASVLANGFTPTEMHQIFVSNDSAEFPLDPEIFFQPAFHLYAKGLQATPRLLVQAVWDYLSNPWDRSFLGALNKLRHALPPGIWDNEIIYRFLVKMFSSPGHTNDFRQLQNRLFIITTHLDTGEIVRFSAEHMAHTSIAKAVQASTAVPGLYPPVLIDGRYYMDGGVRKTVHASTALAAGADLLICINPIVSFNPDLADPADIKEFTTLFNGGVATVASQAFRTMIHSRLELGMAQYSTEYPDKDVVLFEPNRGDALMFFSNVFSFANRQRVCEHAYQTTRRDLLTRRADLEPMLARYGITLRRDVLEDSTRHYETAKAKQAPVQKTLAGELHAALDRLQVYLERDHSPSDAPYRYQQGA